MIRVEFTGSRRGYMHPYLSPDWAEQRRRASRCTEAEPLRTLSLSRLHTQLAAPRSQIIRYLPLMLWWIYLQHTGFPLIWGRSYFRLSLTQTLLQPWLLSPVGPSPSTEMLHTGWSHLTLHLPVSLSIFFKLEDNCLTMLWWSLPYINVNQS